MTTHESIKLAIEKLNDIGTPDCIEAASILTKIQSINRFNQWDKELVISTLKKWEQENGRPPTVTDLVEVNMPSALTVRSCFHCSPKLVLKHLFPNREATLGRQTKTSNVWGFETREDWINCFKEQIDKHFSENDIQISSMNYKKLRDKNTPHWITIASHIGVATWTELLKETGVKKKHLSSRREDIVIVKRTSSSIKEIDNIINKQEKILNSIKKL